MTGPSRAERIRKEATKFSDLAENARSPFLRDYYQRIAERYLSLESGWSPAGRQVNSASRSGGSAAASAAG